MEILKKRQQSLLQSEGLVTDVNEELVAELDILRGEMGTLITDLRLLICNVRKGAYDNLDVDMLADMVEEIING